MKKLIFLDQFAEKLSELAGRISNNSYLLSIRDGMFGYMPFTIIASVFLIFAAPPIPGVADLITNITGLSADVWQSKLYLMSGATLDLGGLIAVVAISKSAAKQFQTEEMPVILTSLVTFMLLTPRTTIESGNFIAITNIGVQSLFLVFIIALTTTKLYKYFNGLNFKIRMPESVPPAVAAPFESIVPTFLVLLIFWILRLILDAFYGGSALELINFIIGTPLKLIIGGSIFGVLIAKFFSQVLWFFGIHGGSIVGAITAPILQTLQDANRVAFMAGQALPNIINESFWTHFVETGPQGCIIALFIVAKSKQYITMRKIAGVPYMFNIGEPTLFGLPVMLNVTYFIPFVFGPLVTAIIAYVAFSTGLVPIPNGLIQIPWTTPLIISGWLVTGSIAGGILQLVQLLILTLIWIPFVKIEDKKLCVQEKAD